MANISFRIPALAVLLLLQAEKVSAFSCVFPQALSPQALSPIDETLPTEEELQRLRSIELSKYIQARKDTDLVVFGQFFKNEEAPFLHEKQLEDVRSLYWPPSENTQLPAQIEYTYFDAYRFIGYQILNGELVPLIDEGVDIRISIYAEYEGIVDALPLTTTEVLGMLRPSPKRNSMEIVATACPTYIPIDPSQLADLLTCMSEGECR